MEKKNYNSNIFTKRPILSAVSEIVHLMILIFSRNILTIKMIYSKIEKENAESCLNQQNSEP